nr:MAG TPA: hypothetical protein [Caudoviricetes sp.]
MLITLTSSAQNNISHHPRTKAPRVVLKGT